ncbi:hypothetical protein [Endozoicomonas sp. Mp262]|uniref:hypothetical protein n=1 Tax=Endozoicomonas sp. Mp262 TaxID=2919499 RepID=UPI0021D963A3
MKTEEHQLQLNLCPKTNNAVVFWFREECFELEVPEFYQRSHQVLAAYCLNSLFRVFQVIPKKGHGVSIHEIHV